MFPWPQKKDSKYYLKKAAHNFEKAAEKGLVSLSDSLRGKKKASIIDEFSDFIDESCDIISEDWKSLTGGNKGKSGRFKALSSSEKYDLFDSTYDTIPTKTFIPINSSCPRGKPSEDNSSFLLYGMTGSALVLGMALFLSESKNFNLAGILLVCSGLGAIYSSIPANDDSANEFKSSLR